MTTETPDHTSSGAGQRTLARLTPWIALIAIGIAWGGTGPLSKSVMQNDFHPIGVSFTGTLIGTAILFLWLRLKGQGLPLRRHHVIFYAVCGFVGTALPHTLGYEAIKHLPVGVVAIIIAAVPIITLVLALPLGLDRAGPLRTAGLLCGLGAVLLLVVPDASLPDPDDTLWLALPVVTAMAYAFEGLYIARTQPPDCGPMQTMAGFFLAAAVMQAPIAVLAGAWMSPIAVPEATMALTALTCLHIGAYAGYVWLIARAGPVFTAQVGYIVTITGVVTGIIFWDETHSAWVWSSLALMLVGLTLVKPRTA